MNIRAVSNKKTTLVAATLTLGGLALAACGSSSGTSIQSVVKGAATAPAYQRALPAPVAERRIEQEVAQAPAARCAPQQVVPTLLTYAPAGAHEVGCTAATAARLAREAEREGYEVGIPQSTIKAEDAWLTRFVAPAQLSAAEAEGAEDVGGRTALQPIRISHPVVVPVSDGAVVAWCGDGGLYTVLPSGQSVTHGQFFANAGEQYAVLVGNRLAYLNTTSTCTIAPKGAAS